MAQVRKSKKTETDILGDGAEIFLEMLNRHGVDYIFMNPGTDTVPVQEAVAKFQVLGKRTPKVVLSLHEFVAMSAAHGYFAVTGKSQVVLVHVGVGTQNLGGALHNAQRSHASVLLCAGTTPYTLQGNIRGGRSSYVHWLQDQFDQAGAVRDYAKWYYEVKCTDHIQDVVSRAFQVSLSEPCGPVYLMLPKDVLMQAYSKELEKGDKFVTVTSPEADSASLDTLAKWLVKAERPLILTGFSGRNPDAVAPLVQLAETLAIPVVDDRNRMNFPSHHPCYQGSDPSPYLSTADVVLILDHDVPYIPALNAPSPEARIAIIDIDPVKKDIPLWSFNADMLLHGDSSKSLTRILEKSRKLLSSKDKIRLDKKLEKLRVDHDTRFGEWTKLAMEKSQQKPIDIMWLAHCINEVVDGDTIVINETVTSDMAVCRLVHTHRTGTWFSNGGSCLGWGLGASLGAKLAAPDKTVVCLMGDGAFLFGLPVASFWAARQNKAPFLTIVFNNRIYNAPKRNLLREYGDGYSKKYDKWIGIDIDPPPDYVLLAQSCGAYGERVEEPDEITGALDRALNEVRGGKAALLDIVLKKP